MIAVVTVLFALPLGYFLKSQVAAYVGYVALYSWAFTFQGAYLMLARLEGDHSAFAPQTFPLSYGVVTLLIMGVGLGLVTLGVRLRGRRASRAVVSAAVAS